MSLVRLLGPLGVLLAGVFAAASITGFLSEATATTAVLVTAVGVLNAVTVLGWHGPAELGRALVASGPDAVSEAQRAALRQCCRGMLVAGLSIGLVAVLLILVTFRLPEAERHPARYAWLARWSVEAPMVGVFLGRLVVGCVADRLGEADAAEGGLLFGSIALAATTFVALSIPF